MLKRLEGTEFDEKIEEVKEQLTNIENEVEKQENSCDEITDKIENYQLQVEAINE